MGRDEFGKNRKINQRGKEKVFDEVQEKDIMKTQKKYDEDSDS
jgi:hypothetical protein